MNIISNSSALATTRIKQGLSRHTLSKKAGLSKLAISRIESGTVNPTPKTAKKICEALGVDFDVIFSIEEVSANE